MCLYFIISLVSSMIKTLEGISFPGKETFSLQERDYDTLYVI